GVCCGAVSGQRSSWSRGGKKGGRLAGEPGGRGFSGVGVEAGCLAGEAESGAPLSENGPGSGGRGCLQRPSPEQSHGRGIPREPSGETVRLAQEHPISASVSLIGQGLVMHAACQFFREKRYYCAKH